MNLGDRPSEPISHTGLDDSALFPPGALDSMFAPKRIAIVGASDRSGWSHATFENLVKSGYPHKVHLVTRRGGTVHGQAAVTSLAQIGEPVDLAYVLTGPDSLNDIMDECADCGVSNLVVIAAGFGEMGEEGRERERELARRAARLGLRILGPNNLGFINLAALTLPWSQMMPWPMEKGGVGFLSQSGALGIFLLNYLQSRDVGISHLITLGNEAVITVAEGIDYLVDQPETTVIGLYLESVRRPQEFLAAAERALRAGKPIVAYKAGRGELGARVTAAHTGSLAGDDRVFDAVFNQHGIIRVDTIEDLVTTAGLFDAHGEIRGRKVGFVTGSGAMCGVISDAGEANGLNLPDFHQTTVDALRGAGLPAFATAQNPLDTTGYVVIDPELLPNCEEIVSHDPNIDVLVVNSSIPASEEAAAMMRANGWMERRRQIYADSPIPIVSMDFLPTERTAFARAFRRQHGLPYVVDSFTRGIPALARLMAWSDKRQDVTAASVVEPVLPKLPDGERRGIWSERQSADLLARAGIPVITQHLASSAEQAVELADEVGYPVVMKISSPDIAHKTDVGGVRLGLLTRRDVATSYPAMMEHVRVAVPDAVLEGVLISPTRDSGVDLIVGIVRDRVWGPILVVGAGGVWVEILKDSAIRALPVDRAEVAKMLQELKSLPLLTGYRGTEPADLDRVVDVITRIAGLAHALGDDVDELEVNPLRIRGSQVEVLDSLVRWRQDVPALNGQAR